MGAIVIASIKIYGLSKTVRACSATSAAFFAALAAVRVTTHKPVVEKTNNPLKIAAQSLEEGYQGNSPNFLLGVDWVEFSFCGWSSDDCHSPKHAIEKHIAKS